jgi:hypothetical protein
MRSAFCFIAAVVTCAGLDSKAEAHFLFIHIGPPAEAGRSAEVYFSEQAQAGDPTFIDKIAHTKLWAHKSPGEFQPLKVQKATDRLRAYLPVSGSVSVIGECEYGVLKREVPFLLRYYPKAIAGKPDELNRLRPRDGSPLEIMATVDADQITLVALRNGEPIPDAVFTTVDADLVNEEISAGPDGRATWKPPSNGRYSIYTRYVTKKSGELNGKKYDEIREFATIAFAWPLDRRGPDAEAVALFEEALAARAQWSGFPGFTAPIAGDIDGRQFSGSVKIDSDGGVTLDSNDTPIEAWVKDQLESIAMHRIASSQGDASAAAKPVLRFADDRHDHPLGRLLIFEGGSFASSYRVKDKQVMVVNRNMGRQNMTITVLDNDRNVEGKFLPRSYTVQFWDATTGELRRTDTIQDRWRRVGSWDLPISHIVNSATETGLSVRSLILSKHELNNRTEPRQSEAK